MRWLRSVVALVAVSLASCGSSGGGPPPGALLTSDQFLTIAHRRGGGENPEETLFAFKRALENGADVLDLDVHATSDGVLVAMHDDTVDRTTNGTGAIKDMTFAELRTLDAGYDFTPDGGATYPYRGMGLVVPTLDEIFEAFPDVPYVIEIKQDSPPIVDAFVKTCREHGVVDQIVGAAFNEDVIKELREAAPAMKTSMSLPEVAQFLALTSDTEATYTPPAKFLQVPPTYGRISVLTPDFIARAARFELKVHAWTINDPEQMADLIDLGVDGIETDYPTRLRALLAARASSSP